MTRKTYCGNLLWQSGLTLLASQNEKKKNDEMKLGAYIAAAFAIVVWSVTFANTRVLLRDFSAFEILIVRFVMAWAALWSMECLGRRGGAGTSRHAVCSEWLFVGMGFTGIVVYQFLENCAIYYTNASNVAILVSFVPIATAIIARIVLKDRSLSIPLVVGSLIAICGVAVVSVGSTIELQVRPLGDLMALIAMLSWGFYSILVDIVNARGVAPITAMRKSFAWSLVIMAPFAALVKAVSPPPTTTTSLPLKKKPSQCAQ